MKSSKANASRIAIATLTVPVVLSLATCKSLNDGIVDPCLYEEECDVEGQLLCMTDTRYRECAYTSSGCLAWDCGT